MSANFQGPGTANNAYIVFDYQSPTNFKYAGMSVGQNQWVIGQYNNGWNLLATTTEQINVNQFYDVRLEIDGSTATLFRGKPDHSTHLRATTQFGIGWIVRAEWPESI
ncbi:MAG: hypothetical protein R3C11_13730 [Planctomycetaceae bacterium]